jgi:integrase-like protein
MLAEDWIAYAIRDRDWKPSTLSDNRAVVNAHINPKLGSHRIERISADDIEDWRDELVDKHGVSRRTANKALIVLGAILEHGRRKHGLVVKPGARRGEAARALRPQPVRLLHARGD